MTAEDFQGFVDYARERGWSHADLVWLLGCGENQIGLWCRDGVRKNYVKLACAALAAGIGDWRQAVKKRCK